MVRRSARDRARAAVIVGGLALGSASGCNDIVALDCDAPAVTDACASTGSSTGSSGGSTGPDADTTATASTGDATAASSDEATSAIDPTGPSETGSFCGDDIVDIDECNNECRVPVCGDGLVQFGEDCDLGEANHDHGTCKSDCSAAICGDGVILLGVEACDGAELDGYSCESFGYAGGELTCDVTCQPDLSMCSFCTGGEPCDAYQPCEMKCESERPCWNETGAGGTCLPSCMGPEDCLPYEDFPTECVGDMCLIPCEKECPAGLLCQTTQLYPGTVCLW